MSKVLILTLIAAAVAQDAKQDDDCCKQPRAWNGSVSSERAGAFSTGASKASVRFGLVNDADAWAACWKQLGQKAPAADFKKDAVLFICYEKWPGTMKLGAPVVKKGVMTIQVALDDEKLKEGDEETETEAAPGMRSVPARCHYDYSMQALARADVKTVRIMRGDNLLGQIALAKAD